MSLPIVLGDEFGYLANAAFLAGYDWSSVLVGYSYYSFGYSLLVAPLFALLDDPLAVYRGALVINAVAASAALFPALSVLRQLAPSLDRWARLAIAVVTCLYPASLVYSSLAWAESTFVLGYWLIAALFGKLQDPSASPRLAGLTGLLAAYLYCIHPRGLLIAATAAAVSIGAYWAGTWNRRRAVWFAATLAAAMVAAELVRHFLMRRLWRGLVNENTYAAVIHKITAFATPDGFDRLWHGLLGQGLYLGMASYGFVVVGALAAASRARGPADHAVALGASTVTAAAPAAVSNRAPQLAAIFVLMSAFLTFAFSVAYQLRCTRADQWLFGRYNEAVLAPLLALGLAAIVANPRRWRQHAALQATFLILLGGLAQWSDLQSLIDGAAAPVVANITALIPHRVAAARLDLLVFWLNSLATGLVLVILLRWHRALGLTAVAGMFLWGAATNMEVYYDRAAEQRSEAIPVAASALAQPEGFTTVQFVVEGAEDRCAVYRWIYQLLLPKLEMLPTREVNPRQRGLAPTLAITCSGDLRQRLPDVRPVAMQSDPPLTLWAVFPVPPPIAPARHHEPSRMLPATAYRSRLEARALQQPLAFDLRFRRVLHWLTAPSVLRGIRGLQHAIDVEITNTSAHAWPSTVHVGLVWIRADGSPIAEDRAFFGGPMRAGDRQRLLVPVVPVDAAGALLPAGDYLFRIGLVHEAVAWFHDQGDTPLDVSVTLR